MRDAPPLVRMDPSPESPIERQNRYSKSLQPNASELQDIVSAFNKAEDIGRMFLFGFFINLIPVNETREGRYLLLHIITNNLYHGRREITNYLKGYLPNSPLYHTKVLFAYTQYLRGKLEEILKSTEIEEKAALEAKNPVRIFSVKKCLALTLYQISVTFEDESHLFYDQSDDKNDGHHNLKAALQCSQKAVDTLENAIRHHRVCLEICDNEGNRRDINQDEYKKWQTRGGETSGKLTHRSVERENYQKWHTIVLARLFPGPQSQAAPQPHYNHRSRSRSPPRSRKYSPARRSSPRRSPRPRSRSRSRVRTSSRKKRRARSPSTSRSTSRSNSRSRSPPKSPHRSRGKSGKTSSSKTSSSSHHHSSDQKKTSAAAQAAKPPSGTSSSVAAQGPVQATVQAPVQAPVQAQAKAPTEPPQPLAALAAALSASASSTRAPSAQAPSAQAPSAQAPSALSNDYTEIKQLWNKLVDEMEASQSKMQEDDMGESQAQFLCDHVNASGKELTIFARVLSKQSVLEQLSQETRSLYAFICGKYGAALICLLGSPGGEHIIDAIIQDRINTAKDYLKAANAFDKTRILDDNQTTANTLLDKLKTIESEAAEREKN